MKISTIVMVFVAQLLVLVPVVYGTTHFHEFVLKEENFTKLCSTKRVLAVNGTIPGLEIRVRRGDTVSVNVHNEGYYGVTLHWHGVLQPRNPWSDGPEYITQCPMAAGTNFTYEINFTTEEGTLWWHAHSDWTRYTIHGGIIILPPEGTNFPFPKPDGEEVLILASWYIQNLRELLEEALEEGSDTAHSDAYTINGEPGDFSPCSKETTYRWVVDHGKTYLLRIINAVLNSDMFFSIVGHNLTMVGIDGAYVKPFVTDYIKLSPGQTMNVLVGANQVASQYYIAARQYWSDVANYTDFNHSNVTAILEYSGNYTTPDLPLFPTSTLPSYADNFAALSFIDRLRSLADDNHPVNVPKNVTVRMYLLLSIGLIFCPNHSCGGLYGDRLSSGINNISFVLPSVSVLQAYYQNTSGVYDTNFGDFPKIYYNFTGDDIPLNFSFLRQGTVVKVLNYGEAVEMVFQSTNILDHAQTHPMHLHGHQLYVVGSGIGDFDEESDPESFNLIDPPYVNTVSVPKAGWAAVRFVANNPGVWYLHCHFDRHMTWGMDTAFIVKNGGTPETTMRTPPAYMPPCGNSTIDGPRWLHIMEDGDDTSPAWM